MATYEEVMTALRNADAAGATEDAAKLAQIAQRLKPAPQEKAAPTVSFGPESFRKSLSEAMEADVFPAGAKFVAGMGSVVDQAALRLKQAVTGLNPQDVNQVQANREILSTGPGMVGGAAGTLLAAGAPIGAATRGVTALLPRLGAAAGPVAAGTVAGATNLATNPTLQGESEAANFGLGFAGGMGGDVLGRGLARVAQPIRQSQPVRTLLGEGVVPTPGQAAGAGSLLGRIEQGAQSIRGPGDIIMHGRQRAVEEFNRAATNRAVPPGGAPITQPGRAGLEEAETALNKAYDAVFSGRMVSPDANLTGSVNIARNAPNVPLSAEHEALFDRTLKKLVFDRIPQGGGMMDASLMKSKIVGDLGEAARDKLSSSVSAERDLGEALMAARNAVQGWLSQSVSAGNPGVAAQIAAIDRAYANKIGVGKAVERAKASPEGVFTPNQLQNATKPKQPLRNFANAGQDVLGSRVPNSGTADRAGLALLLASGAGGAANEYYGGPGYLTALAAAPLMYSRLGSRYMIGDLPGQQAAASGLAALLPLTTQTGRIAGQGFQ